MIDNAALKTRYEPQPTQTVDAERQLLNARFSLCGRYIIGGGFDGVIDRWDVSGEEPAALPPVTIHHAWVDGLALRAEGELAFSADSWGRLACWRYADEEPQPLWIHETAHDGWIRRIALRPDGTQLATCGSDGAVRIWSVTDGTLQRTIQHEHDVAVVAFHPGEPVLVLGTSLGEVIAWSLESGEELRRYAAGQLFLEHRLQEVGGVRSIAFSGDGGLLAIGGTVPKNGGNVQGVPTVLLFDWSTGELRGTRELGATSHVYPTDLAFHPDGFLMATVSGNPGTGKLVFLHPEADEPFFETTKLSNCHTLSLHPDSRRLVVNSTNNGSNGNGRRLDDEGNYVGNWSPLHFLEMADQETEGA
jgi:WD40 repeat protein